MAIPSFSLSAESGSSVTKPGSTGSARLSNFSGHSGMTTTFLISLSASDLNGNTIVFAIRGKWIFSDKAWIDGIGAIIEFQRAFWHDNNFPYFLISLTPFDSDHGSSR